MIQKIKCFFGFHNWIYKRKGQYAQRWCNDCPKMENGNYDPMDGITDWR